MLHVHKSNPNFPTEESQVIFNRQCECPSLHKTELQTNKAHLRIEFVTVASKVSLEQSTCPDQGPTEQLLTFLPIESLHNIWKSCNCRWTGRLHCIPEELSRRNLNFWWQSCVGKHQEKCSPMKDCRSKIVSLVPPPLNSPSQWKPDFFLEL